VAPRWVSLSRSARRSAAGRAGGWGIGHGVAGYNQAMLEVTRTVEATPERVWAVLADGWLYPSWVVGASRMRAVDGNWPAPRSALHHSSGIWPAVTNDETVVLDSEPPGRLKLQAKGRPAGEATVEVRIERQGDRSVVSIIEDVTKGPATLIPERVRQPLIATRNKETLRRLAYIAEGRSHPDSNGEPAAGSKASLHRSRVHGAGES
jgi:uncharacterized protein YndB with AHSA1/START domain